MMSLPPVIFIFFAIENENYGTVAKTEPLLLIHSKTSVLVVENIVDDLPTVTALEFPTPLPFPKN
jgi:hypothetical protein